MKERQGETDANPNAVGKREDGKVVKKVFRKLGEKLIKIKTAIERGQPFEEQPPKNFKNKDWL